MEGTWIQERFALAQERLQEWSVQEETGRPEVDWIREEATRLMKAASVCRAVVQGTYFTEPLEKLAGDNADFYHGLTEEGFDTFYGNPSYCKEKIPGELSPVLALLSRELSGSFLEAVLGRTENLVRLMELFLEVCFVLEDIPTAGVVLQIFKTYLQDYAAEQTRLRCEQLLGNRDLPGTLGASALTECLQEDTFLYRLGLPLSEEKRQQVYKLAKETQENRYQESFCLLKDLCSKRIGLNGPIHKLPFLAGALEDLQKHSPKMYQDLVSRLRPITAPGSTVEYHLGGGGLYGAVDKRFVRLRQSDAQMYLDARTKRQIEKQVRAAEQTYGLMLEELDLLKL